MLVLKGLVGLHRTGTLGLKSMGHCLWVLVVKGLVGLHRTIQLKSEFGNKEFMI